VNVPEPHCGRALLVVDLAKDIKTQVKVNNYSGDSSALFISINRSHAIQALHGQSANRRANLK